MHNEIFFKQLKRSKKTVLYLLLLIIATAFFVGSMNLYSNSTKNLKIAEETYSTLVVTELYGDIDRYGNLVEKNSEEHVGYKAVAVDGYDISDIISSDTVESWDLRSQYGAYVEGHPSVEKADGHFRFRANGDIMRFKLKGTEPVDIWSMNQEGASGLLLYLDVIDTASSCIDFNVDRFILATHRNNFNWYTRDEAEIRENLKKINRSEVDDKLTLYPDVEYVAVAWLSNRFGWSDEPGILQAAKDDPSNPLSKFEDFYFNLSTLWKDEYEGVVYDQDKEALYYEEKLYEHVPFPILRWEDVQNDPKLKAYFDDAWEDVRTQHHVHTVQLTNDFTSVPAYHIGGATMVDGRLITEEEYESGAKVCLVSKEIADYQNWEIGDKLPLKLFETSYMPQGMSWSHLPVWDDDYCEFVHEDEYEIVGFYRTNDTTGNSGISPNTLDLSSFTIYIPEKSVSNPVPVEERPVHGSLFSVKIKNGSIDQFIHDMESKGITTEKEGQFNPKFSFYDQGYSLVQPGLQSMNTTAKLLLALSTILLLIVCALLAYFFWHNQKASVGIFRLLGGTKKNAVVAVLLCALILCGIGAVIGGAAGFGIAEAVGSSIMEQNLAQSERDIALQAYVLGSGVQTELAVSKADPFVTAAACMSVLLFPAVLLCFIYQDINKEPRELLPKNKT